MKSTAFLALLAVILASVLGQSNPICNICGEGSSIGNSTGLVNDLTCDALQAIGDAGNLNAAQCTELQGLAQEPCACTMPLPNPRCNICGDEMMVGNLTGVITIPGGSRSCVEVQGLGNQGLITEEQCAELQPLAVDPCNCVTFICSICPEGTMMTKPGGIIDIPDDGRGQSTCQSLDLIARQGAFDEGFCSTVQAVAEDPCGCESTSSMPSGAPSVSYAPSRVPTSSPPQPNTTPPFSATSARSISLSLLVGAVAIFVNLF